jgi:hypothetical protein
MHYMHQMRHNQQYMKHLNKGLHSMNRHYRWKFEKPRHMYLKERMMSMRYMSHRLELSNNLPLQDMNALRQHMRRLNKASCPMTRWYTLKYEQLMSRLLVR